jgi:hypothetical protein
MQILSFRFSVAFASEQHDRHTSGDGPRSTMGRGGMRGGWKAKKFKKK